MGPQKSFCPFFLNDGVHRSQIVRAGVVKNIRRFFDGLDFIEVRTPILSADSIVDRYVEPIAVTDSSFPTNHHGTKTYYLQTSPEFAMKRLLAAGMTAIYQLTPVFRRGDRGTMHNVEFTMLEWYRVGDDYHDGMELLAGFVRNILEKSVQRRSFRDVFMERTEIDPHRTTSRQLQRFAEKKGIAFPDGLDDESWIDLIFSELVQPTLNATIVYDYPVFQPQLARIRTENDGMAIVERFELFIDGVELANGYHELLDAEELRRRFRKTAEQRRLDGKPDIPVESRLLAAMEAGLPVCCGTALGLERLLLVKLGVDSIDRVFSFPIEIA